MHTTASPGGSRGLSQFPAPERPGGGDPELTAEAERLRVVMIKLRRQLHRQDSPGLSVALYSALATVVSRGELSIGDLAEAENLPPSAITRIVDRLEEAGLVERRPNPRDRRGVHVAPRAEGRQRLEERRRTANAWLARRLARLTAAQRVDLGQALDLLEEVVLGCPAAEPPAPRELPTAPAAVSP
ncbi:MAG TPA: MarR family transcriptional regulator [Candidatus Binatia bacterium]|nr:MarR family transcriptional regulator [Candidatus Binatia bacterium]